MSALSERDEEADVCVDAKGKPEPDAELRDNENVPLKEDINAYFEREVRPHVADAWIDDTKTKVGYEIPFTRHFYKYTPLRALEEIEGEIRIARTGDSGNARSGVAVSVALQEWKRILPWLTDTPPGWDIARFKSVVALSVQDNTGHDARLAFALNRAHRSKEYDDENRHPDGWGSPALLDGSPGSSCREPNVACARQYWVKRTSRRDQSRLSCVPATFEG